MKSLILTSGFSVLQWSNLFAVTDAWYITHPNTEGPRSLYIDKRWFPCISDDPIVEVAQNIKVPQRNPNRKYFGWIRAY